jgi:hypothetical protein
MTPRVDEASGRLINLDSAEEAARVPKIHPWTRVDHERVGRTDDAEGAPVSTSSRWALPRYPFVNGRRSKARAIRLCLIWATVQSDAVFEAGPVASGSAGH